MKTVHMEYHEDHRVCRHCQKSLERDGKSTSKFNAKMVRHLYTHSSLPKPKRRLCTECGAAFSVGRL